MNILWIPHSPLEPGAHRRDQYLIHHLKERHRIYTLVWQTRNVPYSPGAYRDGLRLYPLRLDDGLDAYHVRRLPDVLRRFRRDRFAPARINQHLFQQDVKSIVEECHIDVVVTGPSSYMTGFPPFDLEVPVVFDYLDCGDWVKHPNHPEKTYLHHSDAVLCVSSVAEERAQQYGKRFVSLPNGADVDRMRIASGEGVRHRYGLENAKVVSLIGLTCSPSLYFLEAVLRAKRQLPELKCLLVGRSSAIEAALRNIPHAEDTFVFAGAIPYDDIASFFAASDVGMYPVDETVYYHGASPIKMFEYTAAGKPVVIPHITEAERIGFSNLIFARPDADGFADGILRAFERPPSRIPEVEVYDWRHLAATLEQFLLEVSHGEMKANRAA